MPGNHVGVRLAPFAEGQLDPHEARQIAAHLAGCDRCRRALEDYQFAAGVLREATPVVAPTGLWAAIEAGRTASPAAGAGRGMSGRVMSLAAAAVVLLAVAGWWLWPARPQPWDVIRVDAEDRRLSTGEWVETTGDGTARLRIGEIGTVDVEPGSRMQLVSARPDEHRLSLAHGRISAEIVAPPRIFFVETPASTVVDLGCAYTMEVDQDGIGLLRVTGGWAALEWGERESLVPAGASAHTRPRLGPGTPVFDDAPENLQVALLDFDFGEGGRRALDVILSEARDRDTLTLWHLMSRVDTNDRARVFDRIAELSPQPAGVDRDRAMALEPDVMRHWREELAWTW
jgi:hypothetical protein